MRRTLCILLIMCVALALGQSSKNKANSAVPVVANVEPVGTKHRSGKVAKKSIKVKASVCRLPRALGSGRAGKSRFYYDMVSNECKPFTYGGSHGNKNNFRAMNKCLKTCQV